MGGLKMEAGFHLYLQFADELENDILSGRKAPGQKLPSIREMASLYGVNPNTIQRGLSELKRKGLISGHHTRGFQVAMDVEFIATYKAHKVQSIIHSFLSQMESLGYTKEQTVVSFLSRKDLHSIKSIKSLKFEK